MVTCNTTYSLPVSVLAPPSLPNDQYERFLPREGVCVASVFAPISYPPQPLLLFKQEQGESDDLTQIGRQVKCLYHYTHTTSASLVHVLVCEWPMHPHPPHLCVCVCVCVSCADRHVLVGSGSLHKVDPDRVVCKRTVLSGHPLKINKRSAVIRYMFFNRGQSVVSLLHSLLATKVCQTVQSCATASTE